MALASEKLIAKDRFAEILSNLSGIEGVAEYIPALDELKSDWEERERYITEEAINTEAKYADLVEKYRTRFQEGMKAGIEESGAGAEEYHEYEIEDLYKKED